MKTFVFAASIFAFGLVSAGFSAAKGDPNLHEIARVFGTDPDHNYRFSVFMEDYFDEDSSSYNIVIYDPNTESWSVDCYGMVFPGRDFVKTNGSAKKADTTVDTDEVSCSGGQGEGRGGIGIRAGVVKMSCKADGSYYSHSAGNTTQMSNGVRTKHYGLDKYATAFCIVEWNGLTLSDTSVNGGGSIERSHKVD